MGVRHYMDQLEITPVIDEKKNILSIHLDEAKRSTADINSVEFLLPQWQYDELAEEDEEDCE